MSTGLSCGHGPRTREILARLLRLDDVQRASAIWTLVKRLANCVFASAVAASANDLGLHQPGKDIHRLGPLLLRVAQTIGLQVGQGSTRVLVCHVEGADHLG